MAAPISDPPIEPSRAWLVESVESAATVAMLIALAAYGWLGTYSRMMADDFAYAGIPVGAAMGRTLLTYNEWNGRFSATWVLSLVLPMGPGSPRVLPAATLILWMLALWWLARELSAVLGIPRGSALLVASAVLWATIDSAMNVGQSLYWTTGAVTYVGPLILQTFLAAAILMRVRTAESESLRPRDGLIVFVAFFSGGFSETSVAFQGACIAVAILRVSTHPTSRLLRNLLGLTLAATLAAGLVMFLAPGNAVRLSTLPPRCATSVVLPRAPLVGIAAAARLLVCHPLTTAVLLVSGWLWARRRTPATMTARRAMKQVSLIVVSAGIVTTGTALPAWYLLCTPPPSRANIALHFTLVVTLFACGHVFATLVSPIQRVVSARIVLAAAALLLSAAPLWSIVRTVSQRSAAEQYAAAWDARDKQLRAASNALREDITIEPLPEEMAIVKGLGVPGSDPSLASNNVYLEVYYGLRLVRVNIEEAFPGETPEPQDPAWCRWIFHHLHSQTITKLPAPPPARQP
jgi:hypothetical protein